MVPKEDLAHLFNEIYKLTDRLYETMNSLSEHSKYEKETQKIKVLNFNDITYDLNECYKKVLELCIKMHY